MKINMHRSSGEILWSICSNFLVRTSKPTGERACNTKASSVLGKLCWKCNTGCWEREIGMKNKNNCPINTTRVEQTNKMILTKTKIDRYSINHQKIWSYFGDRKQFLSKTTKGNRHNSLQKMPDKYSRVEQANKMVLGQKVKIINTEKKKTKEQIHPIFLNIPEMKHLLDSNIFSH